VCVCDGYVLKSKTGRATEREREREREREPNTDLGCQVEGMMAAAAAAG
jgi:hypothetical protein